MKNDLELVWEKKSRNVSGLPIDKAKKQGKRIDRQMAIINVYTNIIFTWDDSKASRNLDKHDVNFEEACSIFSDLNGLHFDDLKHSKDEVRYKRLAKSRAGRILFVVFTIRKLKNGKETIRIISARQASKKEREAYRRFKNRF